MILRMPPGFAEAHPGSNVLAAEVVANLIRTGGALDARAFEIARSVGLPSTAAIGVLDALSRSPAGLEPSVIAEKILVSRPSASGVLDTLEKRGFAVRRPHPETRRRVLVHITDEGSAVLASMLGELHRAQRQWTAGLDDVDKEQLLQLLGVLQAVVLPSAEREWPQAPAEE